MENRIKAREEKAMKEIENLVLMGEIPLEEAPPKMARHHIILIEKYCRKVIAERRAKIKIPKVKIPHELYYDDTPDYESEVTIEDKHLFRFDKTKLSLPHEKFLEPTEERKEIAKRYMIAKEELENVECENPLVKKWFSCKTIEEMYGMADEIIEALPDIHGSAEVHDDDFDN